MADETLTLTLDSGGDVVIKLRPDLAPGHVERVSQLAKEGFYDGDVFHCVIPGMIRSRKSAAISSNGSAVSGGAAGSERRISPGDTSGTIRRWPTSRR